MSERTEDGRHIVVDGRRWRASDPAIPEGLRQHLVDELMSARRAVKDAHDGSERTARQRVQEAKVALGERGGTWWEHVDDDALAERVVAVVRALRRARDRHVARDEVLTMVGGGAPPAPGGAPRPTADRVRATLERVVEAGELAREDLT